MRSHPIFVAVVFAILGAVDLALGTRSSDTLEQIASAAPVVLATWLAVALFAVALTDLAGRVAWGGRFPVDVAANARAQVRRWWLERGGPEDRRRAVRLMLLSALAILFAASSIGIVGRFIAPRNAPFLVAAASVATTAALAVMMGATFLVVDRRLLGRLDFSWRIPGLGVGPLLAAWVLGGVAAAVAAVFAWTDMFLAVEGPAILLAAAAGTSVVASVPLIRGRARGLLVIALAAASVGGMLLINPLDRGRGVVSRAPLARHVVAALGAVSDFDGDGAPAFPLLRDCAPFDETRHPFAGEVDGNGIDENCDGSDVSNAYQLPPRRHREWTTQAPNIVFVTFDATRADHVGFMGYERDTTPHLDELAKRGTVFEWAFSQDSGTGPSFWSLFAGKTPFQVNLYNGERFPPFIAKDEKLLGEYLSAAGYKNYAVLCGTMFDRDYWTLRNGFSYWKNVCGKRRNKTAPVVTKAALAVVKKLPKEEPFFLWLHYFDPHHGYSKHDAPFGAEPIDRYDAEIRYADKQFAKVWRALKKRGGDRPTYLVFSADHGEAFGEHGNAHHARTLYKEVTHVPLFVMGPGIEPRRVETPVALNDLFPTFLEMARAEVPADSTMVSLAPLLFGGEPLDPGRPVFQENSYSRPRRHAKAIIRGPYHLIRDVTNDTDELFDYRADPAEKEDLVRTRPEVHRALRQELDAFISTTSIPEGMR